MVKTQIALFLILTGFAVGAQATERSVALVDSFATMCIAEPLDFARADAKAQAMHLTVIKEVQIPANWQGHYVHTKSWLLPLKSGAHEFNVSDTQGPKGHVKGCGISEADVDGNDFRAELVKAEKLTAPTVLMTHDGARRISTWNYGQDGEQLVLVDGTPKSQPGIFLTLMQVKQHP